MDSMQHFYGLCERTNGLWYAEPLNAISNFGFILVAFLIHRYYHKHQDMRGKWIWDVHIMTALIFIIGACSLLFHTFPNPYTEMADVIPIVMFINIYFVSAIFRIGKCTMFQGIIAFVAFLGFTHILVSMFPRAFNDSIGYFSSMTALIMIAIFLHLKRRMSAQYYLLAAIIGVVSLFFRSIDNAICQMFPLGTHFLWHICNATLLYILMKQIVRNVNREERLKRLGIVRVHG